MVEVVPAIIPHSFLDIERDSLRVKNLVDFVQIDIMDGIFTPEPTWPYVGDHGEFNKLISEEIAMPYWKDLNFEIDLMVQKPADVIDDWISGGAQRIIIHVESDGGIYEMIDKVRQRSGSEGSLIQTEVGIAFVPSTPFETVEPYMKMVDFVQCMGNDKIGYHGVELDENVYDKVRNIRLKYPSIPISIDIGVNDETAPLLVKAGCTRLVSGSALFNAENIKEQVEEFKKLYN